MIQIVFTSFLLGLGLAMDACAVSMANGMKEPKMKFGRHLLVAIMFALFQGLMPLIGYFVGSAVLGKIGWIIPWLALVLLCVVGIRMLIEGASKKEEVGKDIKELTFLAIIVQAIATSIDALSVGFTIANYVVLEALICCAIITIVTFVICILAVWIGKKFGDKLGNKAEILGGIILIAIGTQIFIQGIFF